MEASSHIMHEKASNQSSMPCRSTQMLKCGKFLWCILICQISGLTNELHSAHLVKWLTENNWPINISNERELHQLLMAGHPSIQLPSNLTISCDIHVSFRKCQEQIAKLCWGCQLIHPYHQYNYMNFNRSILVVSMLWQMHGCHWTIMCLWHGWFIWSMRVTCFHSFSI